MGPGWTPVADVDDFLMCIFMLSGIRACSLLQEQVEVVEEEKLIIIAVNERTSCQEGTPWRIPLRCLCRWSVVCPYCIGQTYVALWCKKGGGQ